MPMPMQRTLNRAKYLFFGLFLIASAGTFGYHVWFVWPRDKCEANDGWWDPKDHLCANPMPIWRITGRLPAPPAPAAEAPGKR
jgi:hypothetical protein